MRFSNLSSEDRRQFANSVERRIFHLFGEPGSVFAALAQPIVQRRLDSISQPIDADSIRELLTSDEALGELWDGLGMEQRMRSTLSIPHIPMSVAISSAVDGAIVQGISSLKEKLAVKSKCNNKAKSNALINKREQKGMGDISAEAKATFSKEIQKINYKEKPENRYPSGSAVCLMLEAAAEMATQQQPMKPLAVIAGLVTKGLFAQEAKKAKLTKDPALNFLCKLE